MNPSFAKSIVTALAYDPLAEAEKLTGHSYKDDKGTEALGSHMHLKHCDDSRSLIELAGDTPFSMDALAYKEFLENKLGFRLILQIPAGSSEAMFIHWRDGLLLRWDTFHGHRNAADVYFNWQPNGEPAFPPNVSGGFQDLEGTPFLCGYMDAREALQAKLTCLETDGRFLAKWRKQPWLWLLHHVDTKQKGYDHNAINAERLAMLPADVREAIMPTQTA